MSDYCLVHLLFVSRVCLVNVIAYALVPVIVLVVCFCRSVSYLSVVLVFDLGVSSVLAHVSIRKYACTTPCILPCLTCNTSQRARYNAIQ